MIREPWKQSNSNFLLFFDLVLFCFGLSIQFIGVIRLCDLSGVGRTPRHTISQGIEVRDILRISSTFLGF